VAKAAVLAIKVVADASQAQRELGGVGGTVGKAGKNLGKLALPAAIALGAVTGFAKSAVGAASDVEQSMGGLEAVFGKNSDQAKQLAKDSAKATGLATNEYATMAAQIGAQLKGMGTATDDLVPSTDKLIALGADLAATYGGTTADAVSAVSSLLRGERDPIERYGVSLKQSTVNAALAAKGLDGLTGAAATQAQSQVTLELLTKSTADAQGQFAAQTGTAAEQQQIANAEYKNAQAALGVALLPVVTKASQAFAALSAWVAKNSKAVTIAVGVIAVLAGGILVLNGVLKAVAIATKAWAIAQRLLNLALVANPIGLVIAAIALLVVGVIVAYKKVGWFRDAVNAAFRGILGVVKAVASWIQHTLGPIFAAGFEAASAAAGILASAIGTAMDTVMDVFHAVERVINTIADAIRTVLDLIGKIKIPKLPSLKSLNPFAAPPPGAAVASSNRRATASLATAAGRGGSTSWAGSRPIIIQGALDPVAVARQIASIVGRQGLRTGTVPGLTPGWATTRGGSTP
jgi:hypothetical protein